VEDGCKDVDDGVVNAFLSTGCPTGEKLNQTFRVNNFRVLTTKVVAEKWMGLDQSLSRAIMLGYDPNHTVISVIIV